VAQARQDKATREQGSWLDRQNRALRDRGYRVSLDLHQGMVRLRATLPPQPSELQAGPWKQRRISTGLRYPAQASEAVRQGELLGMAIEKTLRTKEPFDWRPWTTPARGAKRLNVGDKAAISGVDAMRQTELWWTQQRKRSVSADTTWDVDYATPLRPLLPIADLQPEHLINLVETTDLGSRNRRRCSQAAATVATALGMPVEIQQKIRTLGKGYSPLTSTTPRNIPTDKEIEELIDGLPTNWQWPAGIIAVYGARPHEALLFAEVLPNNLLKISDGKTKARQSLALPIQWIERWDLKNKRLPAIAAGLSRKDVGSKMSPIFRSAESSFRPYDLRHAWAVRAIYYPQISTSMAAKCLGHSLTVHNNIYQRWYDSSGMEAIQAEILSQAS